MNFRSRASFRFPPMKSPLFLLSALVACALLAGCGKKQTGEVMHYGSKNSRDEHAGHTHAPAGGHVHKAPNGGELVELGAHQFNVEFKYDAARGVLQAWVLDAHAENFVRVAMDAFDVQEAEGARRVITLRATANSLTGETAGDTSCFEGAAPWLREVKHFDGVIKAVRVRGTDFRDVPFHFHP